jgi:hypothetical protein
MKHMVTKDTRVSGTTSEIYKRKRERQVVEDLDDATYLYPSALTHATSLGRFPCIHHIFNSFKPIHKLKVVLKE